MLFQDQINFMWNNHTYIFDILAEMVQVNEERQCHLIILLKSSTHLMVQVYFICRLSTTSFVFISYD
ncbi:unnamed protein product [Rotaria magnacalcarata]|uniref:Uncharacterized protein n=1 Tax=Rotaria magnacalcarata TaxID=392030 RepID=A0A815HPH5_9BILA|nr:unnamed protein product [Rotaria magnacalcarata]